MRRPVAALLLALGLAACSADKAPEPASEEAKPPPPELTRIAFEALPGWAGADARPALAAFQRVCKRFSRKDAGAPASKAWPALGDNGAWSAACAEAQSVPADQAKAFIERAFTPWRVELPDSAGLFTGYFEPEVPGSRTRAPCCETPFYRKPDDIIVADLGAFSESLAGKKVTGRVEGNAFKPYFERAEIVDGALEGRGLELVWLADPVDAFFIEIQGSGRVRFADGGSMRVGYGGKNGRAYRAIGRDLIEMGEVSREEMSMQAIRGWLAANPSKAQELMNRNRSYVFFEERKGPGPIGAAGTPLTAGYSIAVDPAFAPLGGLAYLDVAHPDAAAPPIRRLVASEDVGGAIKGAMRGDLFWGSGDAAGEQAGRMASRGRYYLLAPRRR